MPTIPNLPVGRFDPETVHNMAEAYVKICRKLKITTAPHSAANDVVALKVIEIAELRGARSSTAIYMIAMQEFREGK